MGAANVACHPLNLIYCDDRKPYIILPNNLLYHLISNKDFTPLEKAFYLITDLYSNLRRHSQGFREIEKSAKEWAALLGCSEEWVFKMQKKLESFGFFHIIREKDEDNQNEKNIIIPTLPDTLFYELAQEPNRIGQEHLSFSPTDHEGCKRCFLDDSKMFITFNLKMVKLLLSDHNLTALQKLIWIYFFSRSHCSYTDSYGDGTRNFITTYKEVAALFSCKENTVSTAINSLFQLGYISKRQFRIKGSETTGRRKKKSCWEISALFPQNQMEILLKQPDRQNLAPLTLDDFRLYDLNKQVTEQQTGSYLINYHDRSAVSHGTKQFNNKNNILNTKNIDQAETTNNSCNTTDDNNKNSNVFYKQNLTASLTEISEGLRITEKFNKDVFKLAENTDYPQATKQADLTITSQEHWLVTKTAYTLQCMLNDACKLAGITVNNHALATIKLKETMFNQTEQILIDLWHDFANIPISKLEQEEFLLRRSWLLKLLPTAQPITNDSMPEFSKTTVKNNGLPTLPGDKEDKARKFAYALQERNLAKGYAAEIKPEELASEFIHHAATWHPERLNCKTREEQIDAALSFAWKAAEQGKWKCPYQWLNAQIAQREKVATLWKQW